ncbi:MAG: tetratricopeptide repeat protein, partial [Endomicrobiales bacterium]|nr:tetratricopeptide repeat protein [Endomicrobiales bacterium]
MTKPHFFPKKTLPESLKKVFLILFGILAALALIEAGIRVAGFSVMKLQERQNRMKLKEEGVCRILCVGESTTQYQWPPILQSVLGENSKGIKYAVIDCGLACTNTGVILSKIDAQLELYRPDVVVAMMGINDGQIYEPRLDTGKGVDLKLSSLLGLASEHIRHQYIKFKFKLQGSEKGAVAKERKIDGTAAAGKVGENVDGEQDWQAVLEKDPGNERANFELGVREYVKKRAQNKYLKKLEEEYPEGYFTVIMEGVKHKLNWRYEEANKMFLRAKNIDPKSSRAYAELGWLYQETGKNRRAEKMFRKALELGEDRVYCRASLGEVLKRQRKYEEAERVMKDAIARHPGVKWTYHELCGLYIARGEHKKAIKLCGEMAKVFPDDADAYRMELNCYLFLGQPMKSAVERMYERTIKSDPDDILGYIGLGDIYMMSLRRDDAERMYRKAVEVDPKNVRAWLWLGDFYYSDRTEESEKIYKRVLKLDPINVHASIRLCNLYEKSGRTEEAMSVYRNMMKDREDDRNFMKHVLVFYQNNVPLEEYERLLEREKDEHSRELWLHLQLEAYYKRKEDIANYEKEKGIVRRYYLESRGIERDWYPGGVDLNYREMARKVQAKGAKMVCMQYPTRSIKPLKKMLDGCEGITFVS